MSSKKTPPTKKLKTTLSNWVIRDPQPSSSVPGPDEEMSIDPPTTTIPSTSSTSRKPAKAKKEENVVEVWSDDEEDEPSSRPEWRMFPIEREVKVINHRYVQDGDSKRDGVQVRSERRECKVGQVLNTERKQANVIMADSGVDKIKKLFYSLARPLMEQDLPDSDPFVASQCTPENIKIKEEEPLTEEERNLALSTIKASKDGIVIEGTDGCKLRWKKAGKMANGKVWEYDSLIVDKNKHFNICTVAECFNYQGTSASEPHPKCNHHKGEKMGFVVAEYTDPEIKKRLVILHVLASFNYESEEMKVKRAETALTKRVRGAGAHDGTSTWKKYVTKRESINGIAPTLSETRREYFDTEEKATKCYASWQSVVLMKRLMEPNTTVKIKYLNKMVTLPNGAEVEMKAEMERCGIELSVSSWVEPAKREDFNYPFGTERVGEESLKSMGKPKDVGTLYVISNPHFNYFGKSENGEHNHNPRNSVDIVIQYSNMEGSLPWEQIPLGTCPLKELEKNEGHLHVINMFAYLLKLRQSFVSKDPPYEYPPGQTKKDPCHPICFNKQTNHTFLDKESLAKIVSFMKRYYGVGIYLGPKKDEEVDAEGSDSLFEFV